MKEKEFLRHIELWQQEKNEINYNKQLERFNQAQKSGEGYLADDSRYN